MRDVMPSRVRRHLRLIGWNALLLAAGLAVLGLAGEAWFRLTVPFIANHQSKVFVPGVGPLFRPDTEIRLTNWLDYWTVSRSNRWGFLDRAPPSAQRAAASCHIAMIGDSFVEARHVPIGEKFHVLLEEMAAHDLPQLDITTSAFGVAGTGQIEQLPYYEYARHLRPRLVVLVFVPNDYIDNFPLWRSLQVGSHPEHLPRVSATRADSGAFRLRPPDPDYLLFMMPQRIQPQPLVRWGTDPLSDPLARGLRKSWFLVWLYTKHAHLSFDEHELDTDLNKAKRSELLSRNPAHARLLDGWRPVSTGRYRKPPASPEMPSFFALFQEGNDSPFYQEALAFTGFGLDQFKERAQRDGAALVILATHRMSRFGGHTLARMSEMAAERDIPVIDQGEYIHRQGAELGDAAWRHNDHWAPAGHRWAAAALLEYLAANQQICS